MESAFALLPMSMYGRAINPRTPEHPGAGFQENPAPIT